MKEIILEDFEGFYRKEINAQFYKIRKIIKKQISVIRNNLIEIKVCMDHFLSGKDKIEQKSLKSLNFFSDRIKKEIDGIIIPEEEDINFDNLNKLINSIKKLFRNINEIARKSLPKFQKKFQPEIKELNYITRKLGKKQVAIDQFLRKKYTNVKNAEDLLKKLPKFFTLKDNIEKAKADLELFEKECNERKKNIENLNLELMKFEKNESFKELDKVRDKVFKLKMKINEKLGFKKAIKKLKVELEKEAVHLTNIDLDYLKKFLKNPIKTLIKERKDLPQFSSMLIQLRHSLEENKLNLKTDKKDKTIEHINTIFDEKTIQTDIMELKGLNERIFEIESIIKKDGLAQQLEDIKNQISTNSMKLEHVENDLDRKNKDFTRYLGILKQERESFQKFVEEILNKEIKINITFSF